MAPPLPDLVAVPGNESSWADVQAVFGQRGGPAACSCQRFKVSGRMHWEAPPEELRARFRMETDWGDPRAETAAGLVGFLDGEPVGWVAVEPRVAYPYLKRQRLALKERGERLEDPGVWSITCFVTRAGFRRRGVSSAMLRAAIAHARERGARAIEGYPMLTEEGADVPWGETHVGTARQFAREGFVEVAHPTLRRLVMRLEV
ncbi:MAG TPA: GNAT family N-acetyltransferase [Amnibacterium sp.]